MSGSTGNFWPVTRTAAVAARAFASNQARKPVNVLTLQLRAIRLRNYQLQSESPLNAWPWRKLAEPAHPVTGRRKRGFAPWRAPRSRLCDLLTPVIWQVRLESPEPNPRAAACSRQSSGKCGLGTPGDLRGAEGGIRTHTSFYGQRILSPPRLPFRHPGQKENSSTKSVLPPDHRPSIGLPLHQLLHQLAPISIT